MKQPQCKHTVVKRPNFRWNLNFLPSNVMLVFISVTTHDRVTAAVAVIGFPLQAKKGKKNKKQRTHRQRTKERKMISVSAGRIFCAPGPNFLSGETRSASRCCCSARQESFPPGSLSNGGIAAAAVLNLLGSASSTGSSPAVPVVNPNDG